MTSTGVTRTEFDSLGPVEVPADAYYGAQTQRAILNFQISGLRFPRVFIRALGIVKLSAAKANIKLGLLDPYKGRAIIQAAEEVIHGRFDDQFLVDIFQTGSGTSTNMNANEVIANRACEILGGRRGDKTLIHPNDHVNMGQSTNDVFPTALHIAALEAIEKDLIPALRELELVLGRKADEFSDVVKAGRTHLQDAVPISLGQELSGYQSMIEHGIKRLENAKSSLAELAIGGTAVGTGLNTDPRFAELVIQEVNAITKLNFRRCENPFEALQARDGAVEASGVLRGIAISLIKICNDLRLMTSGPNTGLAEIELPPVQPGSSMMPAKVNPVIPESTIMVAMQVIGNDTAIAIAGQSGQLELNVAMPLIAFNLLQSIQILSATSRNLAQRCIAGMKVNRSRCLQYAERSLALATAIAPFIGYDKAAEVAKLAEKSGRGIREIVVEEKILSREQVDKILDLKRMLRGGART
jgi:fumarate hydratase class II